MVQAHLSRHGTDQPLRGQQRSAAAGLAVPAPAAAAAERARRLRQGRRRPAQRAQEQLGRRACPPQPARLVLRLHLPPHRLPGRVQRCADPIRAAARLEVERRPRRGTRPDRAPQAALRQRPLVGGPHRARGQHGARGQRRVESHGCLGGRRLGEQARPLLLRREDGRQRRGLRRPAGGAVSPEASHPRRRERHCGGAQVQCRADGAEHARDRVAQAAGVAAGAAGRRGPGG
mmetsp:Transcript_31545/g.54001  ORF Transcript_31545/g.54001 Transcript_31545/m.54001 type:complete len:232 (-) Transcript_31545:625-1320(-)